MATKAEQAELIDELTIKLQTTENKLADTIIDYRHDSAEAIVNTHIVASMAIGFVPVPLLDIAALAGAQLNMLHSLCQHYDVNFDEQKGKALLNSLVSGSLPVLTVVGLSSVVKIIPGIGTLLGGVSISVLSGAIVYASGQVFIRHFEAGGTLEDFETKKWLTFFKEKVEEGKVIVKDTYNKSSANVKERINANKSEPTEVDKKPTVEATATEKTETVSKVAA